MNDMTDVNPRAVLVLSLVLDATISNETVRECFDLVSASGPGRGPTGERPRALRAQDADAAVASACCRGCVGSAA
jgi:hypothetical protein